MDVPIFLIRQKQYMGDSTVISMRIPKDMLKDIDEAAKISGRTRNEILSMGLEFALNHMTITKSVSE
jgi:metal-responsive CopG/Arc/MetJ family transcriptional regulator